MTTFNDIVVDVAKTHFGITPHFDYLGDRRTATLLSDMSGLVIKEAKRRYPQQIFEKVPVWSDGHRFAVNAYPEYMVQDFINEIVANFIKEHHPFDTNGKVVYDRYIPTDEERSAKREAKLKAKYGDAYVPDYRKAEPPVPTTPVVLTTTEGKKITFKVTRHEGEK